MKLRKLLLCGVCALSATFAFAQNQTFPFTLTTADGLPEQTSAAANSFSKWISPTYTFDEPVTSFRLTVTHTSWQDAYNTSRDGGNGYIFFTMGEFYLYDAAGNQVALTADNFYGNATESPETNDGVIGNLCDGDISTHYHTMYKATQEPRPIGKEYYLEITLPEPMQSFSFGFQKRSNSANIPCEIIVTKGGVDADPYAEFGFQLGEKVTAIEGGGLYVFADEGNIKSENWEGELTTWLATGRDPRYESPAGTDKYYRIRRTPNVDCIFEAIPAGEGKFFLKSYLGESYIKAANESDGSIFVDQTLSVAEAGKFSLDEEGYLVCNNHYYATNSQETLVAYDHAVRILSIYKASINNTYLLKDLSKLIAEAESALAANKEKLASASDGEIEALEAAIADAKKVTDANTAEEISSAKADVDAAAVAFMKLYIYYYMDYIQELLDEDNFGMSFGQYPLGDKPKLEAKLEELQADEENRAFSSLSDVSTYVAQLLAFFDQIQPIQEYDTLPQTIVAADGEKQLGTLVDYSGYPNVTSNNSKYVYTSKTYVLEQPIGDFYVTFVHTNDGDHGGGYECTALANFAVFDENGDEVDLASTDFETNAQESSEGPMEGICDKYDDGTPDVSTYWHSLWSSSDKSTGEHYIHVTLPKTLSAFSFQYITRGTGIAPKEIVVGLEPYHYIPDATVNIRQQITKASELDPSKYYIFYGNIEKVSAGKEGTGFYAGLSSTYGSTPMKEGVFRVIPGETEGTYKVNFVVDGIFLTRPTSWTSATSTINSAEAGEFFFTESANLADAFKVWAGPTEADEADTKYMLQDWSGNMGYFKIAGEGFEADDTDGESDWYVYEVDPVAYNVFVTPIKKASQLNTEDQYAMYGNLEVVSKGAPGSGFYRGLNSLGAGVQANNFTLFKLEEGANGTYKIHFIDDDVYLKAPTAWAAMATTDKPSEAGEFVFDESSNLAGAFKIYAKGTFEKDNAQMEGLNMLQDWGEYMGSFPIPSLADDDTDGESDWTLFKVGDPNEEELFLEDFLGDYEYSWNNYWETSETKTFDCTLVADPDVENGIIMQSYYNEGPWKGVFDGKAHTITFPGAQIINDTNDERWYGVVMRTSGIDDDIIFQIDLLNNTIVASGQIGIQYVDRYWYETRTGEASNGGWWMLSSSWTKLTKKGGDDRIDQPIVDNASDAKVVSVSFYTVGGQAIAEPVQGVNIVRTVLSDGTVKTAKVLVK